MKRFFLNLIAIPAFAMALMSGCSGHDDSSAPKPDTPAEPDKPVVTDTKFAKGADVSWLTQLESEGHKFYTKSGQEKELMELLRDDVGVNAIRLRVWVNPKDGWNSIDDVMVKARRANKLGLKLMIDFHFSDTWADPGHQETPDAWKDMNLDQLKVAVADHVDDMLSRLKAEGITPQWVQIGNETTQGMLWPLGKDDKPANFAALVNSGYDAVKKIFPDAKVIVHLDQGNDLWRYNHIFDILQKNGGKYDMIGMSLYPEASNWQSMASKIMSNIKTVYQQYGKPVMICEVGMHYNQGATCNQLISYLKSEGEKLGYVDGIFYWEPEAPAGYNGGYDKGCFIDGHPTQALNSFKL